MEAGEGPITQKAGQGDTGQGHAGPAEAHVVADAGARPVRLLVFTAAAVVQDPLDAAETRRTVHNLGRRQMALAATQPLARRRLRQSTSLAPAPPAPHADDRFRAIRALDEGRYRLGRDRYPVQRLFV